MAWSNHQSRLFQSRSLLALCDDFSAANHRFRQVDEDSQVARSEDLLVIARGHRSSRDLADRGKEYRYSR